MSSTKWILEESDINNLRDSYDRRFHLAIASGDLAAAQIWQDAMAILGDQKFTSFDRRSSAKRARRRMRMGLPALAAVVISVTSCAPLTGQSPLDRAEFPVISPGPRMSAATLAQACPAPVLDPVIDLPGPILSTPVLPPAPLP